jgi:hypothetical protein
MDVAIRVCVDAVIVAINYIEQIQFQRNLTANSLVRDVFHEGYTNTCTLPGTH